MRFKFYVSYQLPNFCTMSQFLIKSTKIYLNFMWSTCYTGLIPVEIKFVQNSWWRTQIPNFIEIRSVALKIEQPDRWTGMVSPICVKFTNFVQRAHKTMCRGSTRKEWKKKVVEKWWGNNRGQETRQRRRVALLNVSFFTCRGNEPINRKVTYVA